MTDQPATSVSLPLTGARLAAPPLPTTLAAGTRAGGPATADPFLPAGFLTVPEAFDLTAATRGGGEVSAGTLSLAPDQVVLLELEEGVSVITSAGRLQDTLLRAAPPGAAMASWEDLGRRTGDATHRGGSAAGLVLRLFRLDLGTDTILEEARSQALAWARERLGEKAREKLGELAELGVSRLGTRALLWAIEKRLPVAPGLYRWPGGDRPPTERFEAGAMPDPRLAEEAREGPLLLLIHGPGSNGPTCFAGLEGGGTDWTALRARYGNRIYCFEHRTFSESPIENALALARALPPGARLHLLTHSRGGLVGDLLALGEVSEEMIATFRPPPAHSGEDEDRAYAEHRQHLRELAAELRSRRLRVERYVRVAAPARGTLLASANLDAFLSALLTLLGAVPGLAGNPIYSCLKRVLLEIARHRTDPRLVPGIEAMLPESPLGAFLARVGPAPGLELAAVAGDCDGGRLLKRLAVLFTDVVFFEGVANDLVVDTDSMLAGIARPGSARQRLERGAWVSHFHYFSEPSCRAALCRWLRGAGGDAEGFLPLPEAFDESLSTRESDAAAERRLRRSRGATAAAALPVVIVLPGIMGSHLWLETRRRRVWLDPLALASGEWLERLRTPEAADAAGVAAEKLFDRFYGDLCRHLLASHRVVPFPYDWRRPLPETADRLAELVEGERERSEAAGVPLRFLAHSMGGLVVRALIRRRASLWQKLMAREGARLVMLGTPNQGSHQMVATLLGKSDLARRLASVDLRHSLQEVLDLVAGFPGALQLLPRPGFIDRGGEDAQRTDYYAAPLWAELRSRNRDRWFGDGLGAQPTARALEDGRWLWEADGAGGTPTLPPEHAERVVYVFGRAATTPCGLLETGGRLALLATPDGDGAVTWVSGRIGGIGSAYEIPVGHGDLCSSRPHFAGLEELLSRGRTSRLTAVPDLPATTRGAPEDPLVVDAGPVGYPTIAEVALAAMGGGSPRPPAAPPTDSLTVGCRMMDLRFVTRPVLVGHYEQDAISGPEALIDRRLVNHGLTLRHRLGLYAGAPGTATVVLPASDTEEGRRGLTPGAVVVGLGTYGELTTVTLTEAVRVGTLRYLLQLVDRQGGEIREPIAAPLAAVLLGQNSSPTISVEDSVTALVRGVLAANRQFAHTRPDVPVRVADLEIVELFLEQATAAVRALRRVAEKVNRANGGACPAVVAGPTLERGRGWRQRLDASQSAPYWPRLVIEEDRQPSAPFLLGDGAERGQQGRHRLAEKLRFTYLGQRARSESQLQQHQPGLVESLVDLSIGRQQHDRDFSRTLFQLLIPAGFKDQARQIDRMVMVLDGTTANFPWELLLADEQPLALQVAMVRQLRTLQYRPTVRQTLEKRAYVIGDPDTRGFDRTFAGEGGKNAPASLPPLAAAREEAQAVLGVLRKDGFTCEESIGGEDQTALDVVNRLYRFPYRILHIAAHGVVDQRTVGGDLRTGVVLSGGVLLTAAEFNAMETVPDVVFLNCCHLGRSDADPASPAIAYHRLAASVSRELIQMGVRAVVAAGWAVDDGAARLFAETFYAELLSNRPFGDAVFQARIRTHEQFPSSNTWGAYQAYGDPAYVLDPQADPRSEDALERWQPVTPEELVARLRDLRTEATDLAGGSSEAVALLARSQRLLEASPPEWHSLPVVAHELARLHGELGLEQFDAAQEHYRRAIAAEDSLGLVPIHAIEQLADLEIHTAETLLLRGGAPGPAEARIRSALGRLEALEGMGERKVANRERASLVGDAHRLQAALLAARRLPRGTAAGRGDGRAHAQEFRSAVRRSLAAYRRAGPEEAGPLLHRLALLAVLQPAGPPREVLLARARAAGLRAHQSWEREPDFPTAVMPAEALLVERLLDLRLGASGTKGDGAAAELRGIYAGAMEGGRGTPREREEVFQRLRVLALLFRGRSDDPDLAPAARTQATRTARRLEDLAEALSRPRPAAAEDSDDDAVVTL